MAGFEPTIPEIERTQTYNLDRGTTGIGWASENVSEQRKIKIWGQLYFLLNAYRGALHWKKDRCVYMTTHFHSDSRLRINGAITLLPLLPVTPS
jgi:hypothetical protein